MSDYTYLSEFLGLPLSAELAWNFVPANILEWILLLVASIQDKVFKNTLFPIGFNLTLEEVLNKKWWLIESMIRVTQFWIFLGIWIGYFMVFLLIYISPLNILNFIRFLVVGCCLAMQMWNINSATHKQTVTTIWLIIKYYSGILLILRYIYQFLPFIPNIHLAQFSLIGLTFYGEKELYGSLVPDCAILLLSVLLHGTYFHKNYEGRNSSNISIANLRRELGNRAGIQEERKLFAKMK